MKKMGVYAIAAVFLFATAEPSFAGGMRKAVAANYSNGMCREKITPKGLKGPALKAAWKSCKESPDTYN